MTVKSDASEILNKASSVALEASAGTGKTFQLSSRVVSMLLNGVPPKDILCLTFTNKAADEMLERIISVLDSAAEGTLPENHAELLESVLRSDKISENDPLRLQKAAREARDRLLSEFSSLKVKTISSFTNMILKLFPFEAELRPDYQTCVEEESEQILENVYYSVAGSLLKIPGWKKVFEKAAEALEITAPSPSEEILKYSSFAAKKRVDLKRSMEKNVLTPGEIEVLLDGAAYFSKTALDLVKRFADSFPEESLNGNQRTSVAALKKIRSVKKIIEQKIFKGFPRDHSRFKKYSFTAEQLAIHEEIIDTVTKYLVLKGGCAKAIAISVGRVLYREFKKVKNDRNVLSYADMDERVYEMLVTDRPHIQKDYLYFRLDGKINHILIDEFQDTSAVQWQILKPLAEEAMAGIGQLDKPGSFFYVGDPKQNLYRFRGSTPGLFRSVAELFSDKLVKETLEINYRSDKNIVEFVNLLFKYASENVNASDPDIFKINQKARPDCGEGYVKAEYLQGKSADDFVEFAVTKIKRAAELGWDYGDMAVLVPSNKDGARITEELTGQGVPVRLETSRRLKDTGVFKCLMALADFIETGDRFSFFCYAFTDRHAMAADSYADEAKRAASMNAILNACEEENLSVFEKLLKAIKITGLQERFAGEPDFVHTVDVMAEAAPNEKNVRSFKEAVIKTAASESSAAAEEKKAVTVMTIHKSKGLQFPLVIIPRTDIKLEAVASDAPFIIKNGGEPGYGTLEFVHTKDSEPFLNDAQRDALSLENSLVSQDALNKLYVACTRAEHALILGVTPPPKKDAGTDNISRIIEFAVTVPFEAGNPDPVRASETGPSPQKSVRIKATPYKTEEKTLPKPREILEFRASSYGNLLHAAAFMLEGFEETDAEKAFTKAMAFAGAGVDKKDAEEIKNYVKLLALNEKWRELFRGSVFRERKIAREGELYSIDFYSVLPEGRTVAVDYKTGEITEAQEKNYVDQVKRYCHILEDIYLFPASGYIYNFKKNSLHIQEVDLKKV